MARKAVAMDETATITAERIFEKLGEWSSTPDRPTTTQEISDEFGIDSVDAHALLNELADAGKIDAGDGTKVARGSWFILDTPTEPVKAPGAPAKRTRRTKAEMEAERAEKAAKNAYSAKAAESQDEVMSQALTSEPAPEDAQTGLTRAQVAAELPSVVLEIQAESWEAPEFEPTIPEFDGPESIPAPPEGVSANLWYMAFYANTATARKFWAAKVDEQLKAWDTEQTAKRKAAGDGPPF